MAAGAPICPADVTAPFTDACYHEYLLYDVDTPKIDILIAPPVAATTLRDIQLYEQSIAAWQDGIQALGPDWLRNGISMQVYKVGYEPVPNEALWDPEIIVISASYNPVRFGLLGIGQNVPVTACHGITFPIESMEQARTIPNFHYHDGSGYATARAQCNQGGYTCFVINMEAIGNTAQARRNMYDLNSHEFGHCLGIGHVGDALDFAASSFPPQDIMSYQLGSHVHCVSTLNIKALEKTYGHLLGQGGTGNTANSYVHMDPADWRDDECAEPTADILDTAPIEDADPLADQPDADGDGVPDELDACPGFDDMADQDGDGTPDGCDADRDGDGVANDLDAFPDDATESADSDGDGVGDNSDACPGSDDGLDWDADGIPDGCDDEPGIHITNPVAGSTVEPTVTVTGTTPGTATVSETNVRIPNVLAMGDLSAVGIRVEPWMQAVQDELSTHAGFRGILPVADGLEQTLHVFVDGGLAASDRPAAPPTWTVVVHPSFEVAPRMLKVDRTEVAGTPNPLAAALLPELPRGGAITQGIGPGAPMYVQWDGNRNSVGICTANYAWKDQDAKLWLGAAGHCFLPEGVTNNAGTYNYARTEVWVCRSDCVLGGTAGAQAFFEWQAGAPLDIVKLGAVGYARQNGVGQDFGFVAIPSALTGDVEPEMPGFGGPYANNPNGFIGDLYFHHGNGIATSETAATKSRIGVGDGDGGDKTSWVMLGISYGGDSGSAVNSISLQTANGGIPVGPNNPDARGLLTHGAIQPLPLIGAAPLPISFGTTVAQAQAMANEGGFCLVYVRADQDPATSPAAPATPACGSVVTVVTVVPGIVLGLSALAGDAEVTLDWNAPTSDGGSPITGYTVYYGTDGVTDQQLAVEAAATEATVSGLTNDATYTFTVTANNAAGEGPAAAPVTATPARAVRFTVEFRLDGGPWSAVPGYDEAAETWQFELNDLADGPHALEARLLHLGVQRDLDSVAFSVVTDADGDGVGDNSDACPGHDDGADLDSDGTPDGCDLDRDGDGYSNDQETAQGSDPDDPESVPDNKWTMSECDAWRASHPEQAMGPEACRVQ